MPKPTAEKPKTIAILNVKRTRRFISIHYRKGDEDFRVKSNENPLPSFMAALNALAPIALHVAEIPEAWADNFTVHGITIGELRDVGTVAIHGKKNVAQSAVMLTLATPPALLGTPKTEGVITPPLNAQQIEAVQTMIEEAKRYVKGERAQGTLDLDDGADEDEPEAKGEAEATPPLPGVDEAPAKTKKARRKKTA